MVRWNKVEKNKRELRKLLTIFQRDLPRCELAARDESLPAETRLMYQRQLEHIKSTISSITGERFEDWR